MSTSGGEDESGHWESLWSDFVTPPDDARPRAWWHWMDGNIDPVGIRRDLEWLQASGVRGVQLFDGGMGVPLVVPRAVRPGSTEWTQAIDTAVHTAAELGLELAVATSSGWSAAGGPWVAPADAMKKVVWSETVVGGGRGVERELAPLPAVAGLYQDSPRDGGAQASAFAVDTAVLALPHTADADPLRPAEVSASAPLETWDAILDGSFTATVALPRDPDGWSTAWIEQRFDDPVTVRSVTVGLPGPRGFGAAPPAEAVLQVSDNGASYRDVVRLETTTVPAGTASFAPVTGRRFRLLLGGGGAADALPQTSPGVRLPPVLRRSRHFQVSEFALRTDARVHHAEVKAGFGVVPDYYAVDGDQDAGAISVDQVIDVTPHVQEGVLRWDAPPGDWLILRIGASLTGQTNGPAPADSTGLEVDKLDGRRVARYLSEHLIRFGGTDAAPARFAALLSDSIEAGPQNWTDDLLACFERSRGYDPRPWLPALTGRLVGSASASDRFLYDYRRTLSELLASEYYGTLGAQARLRGMTSYAEALEDARPSLGDDLAMRAAADVPMGAMWTFDPADGPQPTYVADLKGAASVAHVHGKRWVGSEAFTSFDNPWSWTPRTLKHVADLQLSLGVTRFCIHTSPHQPIAAPPPGISLAPFLGQAFAVNETWASMTRPWIDYLARCSAVLSSGEPAVDIAVFVGEEAPVTGLFADAIDDTVPDGFDADYIGADALARILRVQDGDLFSHGARYRLLHLGGSSRRMTLRTLAAVERLVDAGAVVSGIRPVSSPSLADDSEEFEAACERLWGSGRILEADLRAAIAHADLRPRLHVAGAPVRRISRLVGGALVTFLANPRAEDVSVVISPSTSGPWRAWDPVQLRAFALEAGDNGFRVELPAFGSLFVMPGTAALPPAATEVIRLAGPWTVRVGADEFSTAPDPVLWTDQGASGFSGVGVYRHSFTLAQDVPDAEITLELGALRDIARVRVNGQDCGVVWTAPFVCDVSSAVVAGRNELEVHVATPWRNRLIAEARDPSGELFAPMTEVFEPSATPLPAGLTGPAFLRVRR